MRLNLRVSDSVDLGTKLGNEWYFVRCESCGNSVAFVESRAEERWKKRGTFCKTNDEWAMMICARKCKHSRAHNMLTWALRKFAASRTCPQESVHHDECIRTSAELWEQSTYGHGHSYDTLCRSTRFYCIFISISCTYTRINFPDINTFTHSAFSSSNNDAAKSQDSTFNGHQRWIIEGNNAMRLHIEVGIKRDTRIKQWQRRQETIEVRIDGRGAHRGTYWWATIWRLRRGAIFKVDWTRGTALIFIDRWDGARTFRTHRILGASSFFNQGLKFSMTLFQANRIRFRFTCSFLEILQKFMLWCCSSLKIFETKACFLPK